MNNNPKNQNSISSPQVKKNKPETSESEKQKQERKLNFARALVIAVAGVFVLGILNLILYRPSQVEVPEDQTKTQLEDIIPQGSKGSILKSTDGSVTYLVLSDLTQEEFLDMLNRQQELEQALGVDNLEIQPSGSSLREWQGEPETTEGPSDEHEGESGF